MRCSLCGRTAVRSTQLCPGCLAAIKRAEQETISKLDLLVVPTAHWTEGLTSSVSSPQAAEASMSAPVVIATPSHRSARLATSVSMLAFIALPANWSLNQRTVDALPTQAIASDTTDFHRPDGMHLLAAAQPTAPAPFQDPWPASTWTAPPSVTKEAGAPNGRSNDRSSGFRRHVSAARSSSAKQASGAKDTKQAAANPTQKLVPAASSELHQPPQPKVMELATASGAPTPLRLDEPRPDSVLTSLNQALARCAEQSILARTWCQHRVRTRYCDAQWGQRPECPTGINNDQGGY